MKDNYNLRLTDLTNEEYALGQVIYSKECDQLIGDILSGWLLYTIMIAYTMYESLIRSLP